MRREHVAVVICAFITSLSFADAAQAVYHPTVGRWLTRDPIGYGDGMSLFQYVRSRPMGSVDPFGLAKATETGCLCGPDITDALIGHVNDFISRRPFGQRTGTLRGRLGSLREEAGRVAREFENAAKNVTVCPLGAPCKGTFTLGGHCISAIHLDHILGMVYMGANEGVSLARAGGYAQEYPSQGGYVQDFVQGVAFLNGLTLGRFVTIAWGAEQRWSRSDLEANEIGLAIVSYKVQPGEYETDNPSTQYPDPSTQAWWRTAPTLLTREGLEDVLNRIDWGEMGKKPARNAGGSTSWSKKCQPCTEPGGKLSAVASPPSRPENW